MRGIIINQFVNFHHGVAFKIALHLSAVANDVACGRAAPNPTNREVSCSYCGLPAAGVRSTVHFQIGELTLNTWPSAAAVLLKSLILITARWSCSQSGEIQPDPGLGSGIKTDKQEGPIWLIQSITLSKSFHMDSYAWWSNDQSWYISAFDGLALVWLY